MLKCILKLQYIKLTLNFIIVTCVMVLKIRELNMYKSHEITADYRGKYTHALLKMKDTHIPRAWGSLVVKALRY